MPCFLKLVAARASIDLRIAALDAGRQHYRLHTFLLIHLSLS